MKQDAIGLNAPYKTVWWNVDLGDVYNIYSITILFKTYDGFGMYFKQCNYVNERVFELRILASSEIFDCFFFAILPIIFNNQLVLTKTM